MISRPTIYSLKPLHLRNTSPNSCCLHRLGMFFDGLAMLVVTMPVVFPIITGLGFDPIWFGVICVIVIEMGLITPPVGINVFVVKGVAANVPMATIFRGVLPFWVAMALCLLSEILANVLAR